MITFYLKSIRALRKYPAPIKSQMKTALQKLFFYPFAQLLIMTPTILYVNVVWYQKRDLTDLESQLGELPLSSLGLVNALICAFQQKKGKTTTKSTVIIDDLDDSVSYISEESCSADSVDYKEIEG